MLLLSGRRELLRPAEACARLLALLGRHLLPSMVVLQHLLPLLRR